LFAWVFAEQIGWPLPAAPVRIVDAVTAPGLKLDSVNQLKKPGWCQGYCPAFRRPGNSHY
jgi:hypothetical protein